MGEHVDQSRADNAKLAELLNLIADNGHALAVQTFGQYRTALMHAADRLLREPMRVPQIRAMPWVTAENGQHVLFIGGDADGQRQWVERVEREVRIPGRSFPGARPGVSTEEYSLYRAVELRNARGFSCWVYVDQSVSDPLAALAAGNSLFSLVNGYHGKSA